MFDAHIPKVSILMPVYNSSQYVAEAMTSILKQTYANFEFLIIDDASSDDSWAILQRFAATDTRIRIFRNDRNCGVPRSRNLLFDRVASDSEYLAVMDSDDRAHPDRLAKQVDFLQNHPELQGVGSALQIINDKGQVIARRQYECSPGKIRHQAVAANPFAHPSMMFRRGLLESIGNYNESFHSCEDYDFLMRALELHQLGNLPDELLQYRISATQWKQTHLKDTLLATLTIQRPYLFRKRFFSFRGLILHFAGYLLLLLPSSWVMQLFMHLTYSSAEPS